MRKKINIDFVDFWPDLVKTDNYFFNILDRYYDVEISEDPDYIFCSYFNNRHLQYRDCVKILFMGENLVPDFNIYDYAIGFHYMDFEDRYMRLPLYALYSQHFDAFFSKHTHEDEYYLSKKKFCNCVISNPFADAVRDEMYASLNSYRRIDCGGRYHNNVGGPVKDKIAFEKEYRFTMAFENASTPGYTTEKIFEAFAGDTIPIYWGNPRIAEEFNPDSFINCHDFPDIGSAVERIREVNENDELFLKMIKAPALTEGSLASKYLQEDFSDGFIRHIFDQEPAAAIRRNMVYVGLKYQERTLSSERFQNTMDLIRKPVHLIKKTASQKISSRKK